MWREGKLLIGLAVVLVGASGAQGAMSGQFTLDISISIHPPGRDEPIQRTIHRTFTIPEPAREHVWRAGGPLNFPGLPPEAGAPVIRDLSLELEGDPVVSLGYSATAGGFDTTFSISSATLSFPALIDPEGSAEADVTLTDTGGDGAVSLDLVSPRSGIAWSEYNDVNTFAELIGPISVSDGGGFSVTADEATGVQTISGSVSKIQTGVVFKLSARDNVTGRSRFEVVPEPATVSLVILGGVALLRRRRT